MSDPQRSWVSTARNSMALLSTKRKASFPTSDALEKQLPPAPGCPSLLPLKTDMRNTRFSDSEQRLGTDYTCTKTSGRKTDLPPGRPNTQTGVRAPDSSRSGPGQLRAGHGPAHSRWALSGAALGTQSQAPLYFTHNASLQAHCLRNVLDKQQREVKYLLCWASLPPGKDTATYRVTQQLIWNPRHHEHKVSCTF